MALDSKSFVKGVKGLGVCGASVLPAPISAPLEACIYAMAVKAADIVLDAKNLEVETLVHSADPSVHCLH